jgi:eukaryotic-like serine/threonine-protein kinase
VTSIRKVRSLFGRPALSRALVRRSIWIAPVLAIVGLLFSGFWLRTGIENAMQQQKKTELETLLRADVEALKLWMSAEKDYVDAASEAPAVRTPILELLKRTEGEGTSARVLLGASESEQIETALKPWLDEFRPSADPNQHVADTRKYVGYVVLDKKRMIVASNEASLLGSSSAPGYAEFSNLVLAGQSQVSLPFPSTTMQTDEWGRQMVSVPTMFAASAVKDDNNENVAVLGIRIRPSQEFTKILNVARTGKSGETYAFDKFGRMLSSSRFEKDLQEIGLLPHGEYVRSALNVELRDPGVDMTEGGRPSAPRSKQPLTFMAADAIERRPGIGEPGVNVTGYRDYRGVPVIGAWAWLPDYGYGVVTEIDKDEAYGPMAILRTAFWSLFGLLSIGTLLLVGVTLVAKRLERRMREAVVAAGQLGQYALEEKIGEGGMGSVFRGRHSMLRRPTAIKLLEPSKTTEISIARFEREVQHTSLLNHPNTITIYDYGRTDEGVFYYAMEYLDGLSLQSLVERFGAQPDGRVIHILLQVCGSLIEAHAQGLIHRDIKPANIMLTARGGVRDYVKLLDFGLVKAIDAEKQRTLTAADSITGTPLYLPPESIQDTDRADARSDLYSLGGVAYFLLTGRPVFEGAGVMEIIRQQVQDVPVALSKRLGRPINAELEQLVLECLAKDPKARPQSAVEVAAALERCTPLVSWTQEDANRWWAPLESSAGGDMSTTITQGVATAGTMDHA